MLPERRRIPSMLVVFCLAVAGLFVPVTPALSAAAPVTLLAPNLIRANGALLCWTPGDGVYQIHRSTVAGFTPSADTLLTTIADRETTQWTDTTAAPARMFRYKVVTGGAASNELPVTTTQAGQAKLTVTPADGSGAATYVTKDTTAAQGCFDWNNYGSAPHLRVGADADGVVHRALTRFDLRAIPVNAQIVSATMSLGYAATTAAVGATNLQRVTRGWNEGRAAFPGSCDGSGASWLETQGGVRWTADGADADAAIAAAIPAKSRATAGRDTVDVAGVVRSWISGQSPNHGLLIKAADEKVPATGRTGSQTCPTHLSRIDDVVWFGYGCDDVWNGRVGKLDAGVISLDQQGGARFQKAPVVSSSGVSPLVAGQLELSLSNVHTSSPCRTAP